MSSDLKPKDTLRASYLERIKSNKDRILSGQATMNEVRVEGDVPIANADFLLAPVNMTTAGTYGNYGVKADATKTASA